MFFQLPSPYPYSSGFKGLGFRVWDSGLGVVGWDRKHEPHADGCEPIRLLMLPIRPG